MPVEILQERRLDRLLDRVRLPRLAQFGQEVPLVLAAQGRKGHSTEDAPVCGLGIMVRSGGEQMKMKVVLTIAPRRVQQPDMVPTEWQAQGRCYRIYPDIVSLRASRGSTRKPRSGR